MVGEGGLSRHNKSRGAFGRSSKCNDGTLNQIITRCRCGEGANDVYGKLLEEGKAAWVGMHGYEQLLSQIKAIGDLPSPSECGDSSNRPSGDDGW